MIRKVFKYLLFIITINMIIIGVDAGASLEINSSSSTVYVNQTVKIYLNINELSGRFRVYSSDSSILAGNAEGWCDNNVCENGMSTTLTFTALKTGTVTITVQPVNVSITTPGHEDDFTISRSLTINVVKKNTAPSVDVNKVYSKNNYLSNLSIDGYEITPKFNKETLEYKVELEPGTEKININTSLESRVASVRGDGEVSITDGINTIEIIVTAENGNERIYKIIANSPEKDPINIKINKNKYTVVKRRELIGTKDGYEKSQVKIEKFDIPALYNEVTKVVYYYKNENVEAPYISENGRFCRWLGNKILEIIN